MPKKITLATPQDKQKIRSLWEYCFEDTPRFIDYYFEYKYQNNNTLVIKENEDIYCALQLNPYTLRAKQKSFQSSYIVGVSTPPESRGQGYMRQLLPYALQNIVSRGHTIAILMAIDSRLYSPYGFAFISNQLIYELPTSLCKAPKTTDRIKRVSADDAPLLAALYTQHMTSQNFYIWRNTAYYELLLKEIASEDGYIFLLYRDDKPVGYLVVFFEDDYLLVREFVYCDRTALHTGLNFIYQHNTQRKRVRFLMPANDVLQYIWPNSDEIKRGVEPFMMARIINLEDFLTDYPTDLAEGVFAIKVLDPYLSHNNGVFLVTVHNHLITVLPSETAPQVTIGIGPLTQWVSGYLTLEDLLKLDLLQIHDNCVLGKLKRLFGKSCNYLHEYV